MSIFYVPESAKYPGTYAIGIKSVGGANCTSNIQEALQFQTERLCQEWCDKHTHPAFVPKEHIWMETQEEELRSG